MLHLHGGVLCSHKKNTLLIYTTAWTNPKAITLSERSQTQKAVIPLARQGQRDTDLWLPGPRMGAERDFEADGTVADLNSGGGYMAKYIS